MRTNASRSAGSRGRRSRLRGTSNHAATVPNIPAGMFTRKIRRHPPLASNNPPNVGAEQEPEGLGRSLVAEPQDQPIFGHGQVDDGDAVGLQHHRAQGLYHAEGIEGDQRGGGCAERRTDDEDDEAVGVREQLAANRVSEVAHRGHRTHDHDQVTEPDPGDGGHARSEMPLERREGDGDDAGVELTHERRQVAARA